jgi:hypothetical protein
LRLLLDTHRLTDALRGDEATGARIEHAEEVRIPFVVLAEIKAGFASGTRISKNEALLHAFMRLPGVGVLFADRATVDVYARLFT